MENHNCVQNLCSKITEKDQLIDQLKKDFDQFKQQITAKVDNEIGALK